MKDVYILGIESSCDDTSAAVLKNGILLSNVTASQAVHEAYGGVVPELASRAHQQNVVPVVDQAIKKAGITKEDLTAIAFTRGPGLMGSLLVGVSFAKGFARSLGIPMIDVNHLQGHVMAHFIKESEDDQHQPVAAEHDGGQKRESADRRGECDRCKTAHKDERGHKDKVLFAEFVEQFSEQQDDADETDEHEHGDHDELDA